MGCFCAVPEEFYCEVLFLDESKLTLTTQQQGIKVRAGGRRGWAAPPRRLLETFHPRLGLLGPAAQAACAELGCLGAGSPTALEAFGEIIKRNL